MTIPHAGWTRPVASLRSVEARTTPFGAALRTLMARHDLTQTALGERIGMDHSGVGRLVRGGRTPTLGTLARLVRVFPAERQLLLDAALATVAEMDGGDQ